MSSLDDSVSLDDSIQQDEHDVTVDENEANKENVLAETMKTPPRGW